jgi:hypothetical protein
MRTSRPGRSLAGQESCPGGRGMARRTVAGEPATNRVRGDIVQDQGADTHHGMLADGAGSDHDGEAGQPGSLADEDVATGLRDRDLTLGTELGDVVGAGQDRHAMAKEGVLPDGDIPRRQVEECVVDHCSWVDVPSHLEGRLHAVSSNLRPWLVWTGGRLRPHDPGGRMVWFVPARGAWAGRCGAGVVGGRGSGRADAGRWEHMGLSLNLDSIFRHPSTAALQIKGVGGGGADGAAPGWRAHGAGEEPS